MEPKRFCVGEKVVAPRTYGHFETAEILPRHSGRIPMEPPKCKPDNQWAESLEARPIRDELGDYLVRFSDGHVVRANEDEMFPAALASSAAA